MTNMLQRATTLEFVVSSDEKNKNFKLNSLLQKEKWEHAAKIVYKDSYKWIVDSSRADGMVLTSLNSDSVVLDVGCGFGTLSFQIAEFVSKTVALDINSGYLNFISARKQQDKVCNVFPISGEALKLPFRDGYFDLVVLNGVFERIPQFYNTLPPVSLQNYALREICRVLKPGGELYIGIENRFGLKYLLGAKDEHTGLRFITCLPRNAANLYSLLFGRGPYRLYTHSSFALCNMLKVNGFIKSHFYSPVPSYRNFRLIFDLEERSSFDLFMKLLIDEKIPPTLKFTILSKILKLYKFFKLNHLKIHRFLSNYFIVIAKKE